MIDRSLNYGRHHIENFLILAGAYATVLDIGAGRGDDLLIARKVNPKSSLHAIEYYPEYIQKLKAQDINVHPINIEKDTFPFADSSIDICIMNQGLEHGKEVFWVFHEVSLVLRKGGYVIIGVPNLASLHNRILLLFGKQPTSIKTSFTHIRGFTKGDIQLFLENCFPSGYKIKSFGRSNFYPFPSMIAKFLANYLRIKM